MKKIIFFLTLGAAALTLSACGAAKTPAATPATVSEIVPAVSETAANEATPLAYGVDISGYTFSPSVLIVTTGATVTWTNNDAVAHQIKSAAFNSELLSADQSFSFAFATPGIFEYSCSIHPSMTGKIIVK